MSNTTDKKKGGPLGHPDRQGRGDARPEGAGDEGGLGFVGDQRGENEEERPEMEVDTPEGEPMKPTPKEGTTDTAHTHARDGSHRTLTHHDRNPEH